jgi:cell division protein FtsB
MEKRTRRLVGVGVAGLVALFGPGAFHLLRLAVEQRRLDRQLAALAAQHDTLLQEQARLQSDPTYVEGLIRSTFKWAKPDEYVIPLDSQDSPGR